MDYSELIETMSPEIYQNLLQSVERGKWPDGRALTAEQRENAMQAIIAWGEKYLPENERVGYVKPKPQPGDACDEAPLSWK